ncbi:hypothetical protein [Microbacterium sp. B24]|uniref:hypothetical protein n=1 Tax=Microbacterium sp. B24 TaxID=95616 RepID=UPI00041C4CA5|nr:hypothetical protein [Microbacterium sp. B24]
MRSPARRSLPALAVMVTAIIAFGGCSSTADAAPAATTGGTHAVAHARGITEVPDDPQRVVVRNPSN